MKAGKRWVIGLELKSFFDWLDNDQLMSRVASKVRDKRLLRLIGNYLRAPMQTPDGL